MAKQRTSYISQQVSQFGQDWIAMTTPERIQGAAKRIVKDMVNGNIDYENHGIYFLDLKFLENLIIALNNELEINTLNYVSCKFYYGYYPQTPNLGTHVYHLERLGMIYQCILEKLNLVKQTQNVGYLTDISGMLFNDRSHLN